MDEKNMIIEDVPSENLKKVICPKMNEIGNKKYFYVTSKSKWNRFILYDPLLCKRYAFINEFV
jgi:hypothetical protein